METAKIQATPTFVIGDKTLEGGQTLAQLDAVLALACAKPPTGRGPERRYLHP